MLLYRQRVKYEEKKVIWLDQSIGIFSPCFDLMTFRVKDSHIMSAGAELILSDPMILPFVFCCFSLINLGLQTTNH